MFFSFLHLSFRFADLNLKMNIPKFIIHLKQQKVNDFFAAFKLHYVLFLYNSTEFKKLTMRIFI